jgi:hypothetical protein
MSDYSTLNNNPSLKEFIEDREKLNNSLREVIFEFERKYKQAQVTGVQILRLPLQMSQTVVVKVKAEVII